jgi:hypothetical protein
VPLVAPYGPQDYLAAIDYCHELSKGRGVIVVDSASHEHEGVGGVLEQHAQEHKRLGGSEGTKMLAWSAPKQARRKLINRVVSELPGTMATIWCFRAKGKLNLDGPLDKRGKKTIVKLGWMPVGGEEFLFEMTVRALFKPGCNGVPDWAPQMPGEREVVRVPRQFRELLNPSTAHAMCEDDGEAMQRWMMGEGASPGAKQPTCRGTGEWKGKPLAEMPADVLIAYKAGVVKARDGKTGREREELTAHIEEIDSDLERRAKADAPDEGVETETDDGPDDDGVVPPPTSDVPLQGESAMAGAR